MARRGIRLNHRGLDQLINSDEVARDLHRRMEPVLAAAKAAADVSGTYEASLSIEDDHTDRARSIVLADVSYACAREAKDRTLGRALDAAG